MRHLAIVAAQAGRDFQLDCFSGWTHESPVRFGAAPEDRTRWCISVWSSEPEEKGDRPRDDNGDKSNQKRPLVAIVDRKRAAPTVPHLDARHDGFSLFIDNTTRRVADRCDGRHTSRGTPGPRRLLPQHRSRPDRRGLCHAGISLAAAVALGYTTASLASRWTLSVAESFMRQLLVSLVVLLGAGSTGYAQNDSGTLRGVYGPGQSAPTAPAAIGGIYGPGQSAPAALPQPSASPPDSGAAVPPAVLISGPPALGQALPIGINAIPIPGQPGYGTAIVNGHNAIVERGTNRIIQLLN
jgi:hypothetical protein